MKISEARASIELKVKNGLITMGEAKRMQRRLSQIQARRDISWNHKKAMYAIWA